MNLPAVIDVALGLVVLYFLLSTICSFAVEMLASWLWWRKILLYKTIARLVTGESDRTPPKRWLLLPQPSASQTHDALSAFWIHPLAVALAPDKKLPSYIEPSTFAAIVIDLAVPGAKTGTLPETAEGLERLIRQAANCADKESPQEETPPSKEESRTEREEELCPRQARRLRQSILTAFRAAGLNRSSDQSASPLDELRKSIEKWYNEAMARSTGEYKRKAQGALLVLGAIIAVAFNADTIRTVYVLSTSESLRSATATYAAAMVTDTNLAPGTSSGVLNLVATNQIVVTELRTNLVGQLKELQKLQQLGFPLGWKDDAELNFTPYQGTGWWKYLIKIAGLLATAFAVSLGAPFWFDLLNKLVSLRGSGSRIPAGEPAPPKTKAGEEGEAPSTKPTVPALAATVVPLPPSDFGTTLADARVGFDVRKAYWLSEVSLLAYSAKASVASVVQKWGLDLAHFFEDVQACQGFLVVSKDKKVAVLAFRGTETKLEDWKTDAEFKPAPSPTGVGETHEGFTKQLDKVYGDIVDKLSAQLQSDTLLYVTGHSLGAALATLMAARLASGKTCGVHSVHTFGSPRVGDPEFARFYQLALGHCTFRVVNAEDLVTRVPPRAIPATSWKYDHVGQVVFFDTDGRMQLNAGFWERFMNTVVNAVQDFRNTAKAALKDHSMEGYVRLLKGQIRE